MDRAVLVGESEGDRGLGAPKRFLFDLLDDFELDTHPEKTP
jgi:hypothetical protein